MAKKPVLEIGEWAPSNLKFGIIVAIAILWVQFLRSAFNSLFSSIDAGMALWLSDLIVALIVTVLGYLLLQRYRKIKSKLRQVKV